MVYRIDPVEMMVKADRNRAAHFSSLPLSGRLSLYCTAGMPKIDTVAIISIAAELNVALPGKVGAAIITKLLKSASNPINST